MRNKNESQPTGLAKPDEATLPMLPIDAFDSFPVFTPFSMMRRFTDDMERFFDNFNNFGLMPALETPFDLSRMKKFQKTMWAPQIEVSENDGHFLLKADLPGLRREDINVEFADNALVISGERNMEKAKEEEGFYHTERNYGSFYRSIPLPDGFDADKAEATFHNGVLEITLPVPKKETKKRKLPVTEKAEKAHAKGA